MQTVLPGILPTNRHLIPLEAAEVLLNRNEDEVLSEIHRGELGHAWNIATPSAERREIRIWRESLQIRLQGGDSDALRPMVEVIESFLPLRDPPLTELAHWFACSGSHITNLVRAGCLKIAGRQPARSGIGSVTRIERNSVFGFLASRREI